MSLKVAVVTFAAPQLEKIPRLTESPLLKIPSILQQFFHPPFLGIFGKVNSPPPPKNWWGGGGGSNYGKSWYIFDSICSKSVTKLFLKSLYFPNYFSVIFTIQFFWFSGTMSIDTNILCILSNNIGNVHSIMLMQVSYINWRHLGYFCFRFYICFCLISA